MSSQDNNKIFSRARSRFVTTRNSNRLYHFWDIFLFVGIATLLGGIVAYFFCVPRSDIAPGSSMQSVGSPGTFSQAPSVQRTLNPTRPPANNILSLSPGIDRVTNFLINTRQVRHTRFGRNDVSETESYSVRIEGELGESLTVPETFVMERGVQNINFEYIIDSAQLGIGHHEGSLVFTPTLAGGVGSEKTPAAVGIAVGIRLRIEIDVVGEANENIQFQSAHISDGDQVSSPVLSFYVNNMGNTIWFPEKIELHVADNVGNTVAEEKFDGKQDVVYPGEIKRYQYELLTPFDIGQYAATLIVHGGSVEFSTMDLSFSVFRGAALLEKGNFLSFETLHDHYFPREQVKFIGRLQNIGPVPLDASLVVEVFRGEVLVDVLRSPLLQNLLDETVDHVVYFSTDVPATYTAKAHFEYGQRRTQEQSVIFSVDELPQTQTRSVYSLFGVVVFVLIVFFVLIAVRHKKKHHHS